jgi:pyruvate kinase
METKKSLDYLESIIAASDGIMVARGDMGVELPVEEIPYHQKIIIKEAIRKGLPVITATQMLQSMTEHPYPTRAEVSDIANAVYDLTDSVMLSGETAVGKFPVETVQVMKKTAEFNESKNRVDSRLRFNFDLSDNESALCDTAYGLYVTFKKLNRKIGGFLVFTQTGRTVQLISRYRPLCPIFAFAHEKKTVSFLTVHFGVEPFYLKITQKKEVTSKAVFNAIDFLKKRKLIQKGEILIALHGFNWGEKGSTSTISLITVT